MAAELSNCYWLSLLKRPASIIIGAKNLRPELQIIPFCLDNDKSLIRFYGNGLGLFKTPRIGILPNIAILVGPRVH